MSFSVERLQRLGSEAAMTARRKEHVPASVSLSCGYLGVAYGGNGFDASLAAQASQVVWFEWRVVAGLYQGREEVSVRCNHIADQGIRFPKGWRAALKNLDLDEIVRNTVDCAMARSGLRGVHCQLLGQPNSTQARG